ncbi:hypothetical protein [Nocardia wallacei]|uniref:WXG100-like domain-containing protein n=1 Tax=Nocardia wallacei TaxID=480035 RepID=UPI002454964E|nr:hypothetical protein [Nocardia wallacei]
MSIHVPSEVVLFLNAAGIPYPDVDVDQVRELSQAVRDFAADIRATYDEATGTVEAMGSAMSGNSYRAIVVGWADHKGKMSELDSAFDVGATALDIAADFIEGVQIAVLVELAALAAAYTASVFTPFGVATGPGIAAAARRILEGMAEVFAWYIGTEVLLKAIEPLVAKFDEFIRSALRPPAASVPASGSPTPLHIDFDEISRFAEKFDKYGDDILYHGERFGEKLNNFDFTTPGLNVPQAEWPSPSAVPPNDDSAQPDPMTRTVPGSASDPGQPTAEPSRSAPEPGQPNAETSSENGPEHPSAPTAHGREDGGTNTSGGPPLSADTGRSGPVPPEVLPPAAPGPAHSSTGISSGGKDPSYRQTGHTANGTPAGYDAARGASATAQNRGSGESADPAASASGLSTPATQSQAQAASTPQGQRSAEAAPRHAQRGGGRAAADSGSGAQQPSGRKPSQTPWSRTAGKAARGAATTKRSGEKAPAISAGDTGNRGETSATTSPISREPRQTEVFVPNTGAAPPVDLGSDKIIDHDRDLNTAAEPVSKDADPSAVSSRTGSG